jgi:hypothetical protein
MEDYRGLWRIMNSSGLQVLGFTKKSGHLVERCNFCMQMSDSVRHLKIQIDVGIDEVGDAEDL